MEEEFDLTLRHRRRHLVQVTNAALFSMMAAFIIFRFATMGFVFPPLPTITIAFITLMNWIYVRLGGSLNVASWLILGFLTTGLLMAGVNSGAFAGVTVILSPILPVIAILLIGMRAGWFATILVFLILTTLLVLQSSGLIPQNPVDPNRLMISRYIAVVSTMLICTWITWEFSDYLREIVRSNRSLALTDHLTGLANRRSMDAAILREVGRAHRYDSWFSLILTDVDHFKRYNDARGHQAGDRCLVKVAEALNAGVKRPTDLAARFGGEEFIIMLPDTDYEGACAIADDIRREVLRKHLRYEEGSLECISLTLGVVSIRGSSITSIQQLLHEADQALYYGKGQGRNCVIGVDLENQPVDATATAYVKCA